MNIKTFYTIYYRHRIQKANLLLKIYILLILPIRYLLNIPFMTKKINLDEHSNSNVELFKKDLDYLFEYFNSDKGNYYMSFDWFNSFVYRIVVDKKCVSKKEINVLNKKPILLPFTNPFGALL